MDSGLAVVGPLQIEVVAQLSLDTRVVDRESGLDASIEVARHPVGGGAVVQRIATISEDEDARMLQVAAQNGDRLEICRCREILGGDREGSPHDQPDLDASLGGFLQNGNDLRVGQVVQLRFDGRWLTSLGTLDFRVDETVHRCPQSPGRNEQMLHFAGLVRLANDPEEPAQIPADPLVRGQEEVVGVEGRGVLVQVSGADESVEGPVAALPAFDQSHLGVDLEALGAEDHPHAFPSEHVGELDVRGLVEARREFHHGGDLLPVARGVDEGVHHSGVVGDPVHGDRDARDLGVDRRLPEQVDQIGEALIGGLDQDVAAPHGPHDGALAIDGGESEGRPGFVAKPALQPGKADEVLEVVVPPTRDEHAPVFDLEAPAKRFQQVARHGLVENETYERGGESPLHALFHPAQVAVLRAAFEIEA